MPYYEDANGDQINLGNCPFCGEGHFDISFLDLEREVIVKDDVINEQVSEIESVILHQIKCECCGNMWTYQILRKEGPNPYLNGEED